MKSILISLPAWSGGVPRGWFGGRVICTPLVKITMKHNKQTRLLCIEIIDENKYVDGNFAKNFCFETLRTKRCDVLGGQRPMAMTWELSTVINYSGRNAKAKLIIAEETELKGLSHLMSS
jgi:hypothetical protein